MRENAPAPATVRPLTSGQAAARLGVCARTLLRAVGRGEITPAYRTPGGFARFQPAAVEAYARRLSQAGESGQGPRAATYPERASPLGEMRPTPHACALDVASSEGAFPHARPLSTPAPTESAFDDDLIRATTERPPAEEELRRSHARVEAILASITDGFFALDTAWRFTYLNARAEALLGRTRAELLGTVVWDAFPEAVGHAFYDAYHRAVAEGVAVSFEEYYPPHAMWVEVTAYPSAEGLSVYFDDISARKATEQALRASEERLRTLVTRLPVILFALDADGVFTLSDGVGLASLGVAPGQVVGRAYRDIHAAQPEIVEHLGRALAGEEVAFLNRVEGRTLDARATPLRDAQGRVTGVIGVSVDVTDRVRAEEAHARLAALVEASDDAIIGKALNGAIVTWNGGAARLYGYTAAEAVGRSVDMLIPPDHPDEGATLLAAVARGEGIPQYETECMRKDGARVPVSVTISPIRDRAGLVTGAAVVARDITARVQVEEALRRSEARFRALSEHASDLVRIVDGAGIIRYASPSHRRLLGYAPADLVGRRIFDVMHPADVAAAQAQMGVQAREGGAVVMYTVRLRHADGSWRWQEAVSSNHLDDPAIRGFVVNGRDITERRQAEEALQAREARFRALSEHASDLVAILDRAGVFRYVGPSYERLLGYAPAALEGRRAVDVAHPDDAPALAPRFAAFVATPGATVRTEGRVRHADGSWRVMEMVYHNRLDDPAIGGIIVNSHDVTARVQMQRDLDAEQQRYRSLFAHHPDAVFALGRDGALTSANAACAALTGYTVAELLTLSFPALIAPEDLERAGEHFMRAVAGEPQHDVALGLRRADGDGRALSVTVIPIMVEGVVVGVYGIAKDVTAHTAAQRALQHQATHDALTDLPNRARLRDRLAQAWATGAPPALLLLDLDGFKEVNDTYGHSQGDALLREVSRRLRGAIRRGDTVARLGGDEFAVALPGADAAGAECVAHALRAALDTPIQIDGHALHLGASVGIALAPAGPAGAGGSGTGGDEALDTLLRHADVAMYAAKRGRRGQQVYDPALDTHSPERLGLVAELRAAIAGGALALHYQPQADLASGRVRGVEALVRWPHPTRGLIPPDGFISLAEQTGLIAPLTDWVLEEAIRQGAAWRRAGLTLSVSVNLSVWTLHDPALPERIAALLRAHAVPPSGLHLEVTETTLMADPERALAVLRRLAALGVGLAVDDFGAGYSSLAYLKTLPVDELKIDKGFVRELATDAADAAIVASTVGLGHALGLRVVAEGIEDRASWEALAGMDCDVAQGYYLSRPLPPDTFARWLREAARSVA